MLDLHQYTTRLYPISTKLQAAQLSRKCVYEGPARGRVKTGYFELRVRNFEPGVSLVATSNGWLAPPVQLGASPGILGLYEGLEERERVTS